MDLSGPVEARYLAFLETISSLRPSLHRYCARMTGSVMNGEDVVQEALFEAYRKLDKFDESRPLKPWLFRIAHNRCIDFLRRRGVRDEAEMAAAVPEVTSPADAALLGVGKAIEHLVAVLPPRERALLVNAQHVRAIPGKKTDRRDSVWLAELLQHGLLRSSFVPSTPIRELRDLTRYRVTRCQECNRIANRIQKVLEDANVKLASVASDPLGASGRAMVKALIAGEDDPVKLAELARGLLRRKLPALQGALDGRVTPHHRFLLGELLDHLEFVEGKIRRVETTIEERLRPFEDIVQHLCTIPGVDRVSAWGILSEIGLNMDQFPDARHLASWAGLCPGNWESAGKRISGRIRKGSAWLRRHLCQCAWAVSTKRHTYLSALFRRLAARRGVKRASSRSPTPFSRSRTGSSATAAPIAISVPTTSTHAIRHGLDANSSSDSKDSGSTSRWRLSRFRRNPIFEGMMGLLA